MDACQTEGCTRTVTKPGYSFCLDHYKAEKAGKVKRCPTCRRWRETAGPPCLNCLPNPAAKEDSSEELPVGLLSSRSIGKQFRLTSPKTNLILAELGWIEKYGTGWAPTERGNALGANVREMRNGTPFVVWPESILQNPVLNESIAEQSVDRPQPATASRLAKTQGDKSDFRSKFPATLRTQDGHMVRSRAEVLIDNWLYMQGIVHAYERRLPIEEECYCDFYLPGGKGVYIEFWGLESDPRYRDRMAVKQSIYAKYGLRLVELGDTEIERLDDLLPQKLLRFGLAIS